MPLVGSSSASSVPGQVLTRGHPVPRGSTRRSGVGSLGPVGDDLPPGRADGAGAQPTIVSAQALASRKARSRLFGDGM